MLGRKKVLVVDDSAFVRQVLTQSLSRHPHLEVVGTAADPYEARERIIELKPDVLTLDIEMPRMDGLTFLGKLMKAHPMPVVVVSSLTAKGTAEAMEALRLGATEVIGKPGGSEGFGLSALGEAIADAVYEASFAQVARRPVAEEPKLTPKVKPPLASQTSNRLIVIGASTGGTEALRLVFQGLPGGLPPIALVQHILPGFTTAYAERLDSLSAVRVKEAQDGEPLLQGHAYVAPSQKHLRVVRTAGGYAAAVEDGPKVRNHQPSVDVLMHSAVEAGVGAKALGIILTGMGDDGARGLLALREKGATTLGQDEDTSVVYGMPRVAWELGAVEKQLPLPQISKEIVRWASAHA